MSESKQTLPRNSGYWRSLSELADSDEFRRHLETEFPGEAVPPKGSIDRRQFLQVMSASMALAGLAGCQWPEEEIVPFGKRPGSYDPGQTKRFATSRELGGVATGLLVTSFDGRPIKVEGNPDHPAGAGAADLFAQASILDLYDPDRSKIVRHREGDRWTDSSWDAFEGFAKTDLLPQAGQGLAILTQMIGSPSTMMMLQQLQAKYPEARIYNYEPLTISNTLPCGTPYRRSHLNLANAKVIVDFDSNLLVDHHLALNNARGFGANRTPDDGMNRLYVFEPSYSATGAIADHRFPSAVAEIPFILATIAAELIFNHHLECKAFGSDASQNWLRHYLDHPVMPAAGKAVAADLIAHRGEGLLIAGPRQSARVRDMCRKLNQALGNENQTISYIRQEPSREPVTMSPYLTVLESAINSGEIDRLIILDGNPVYDLPVDIDLSALLQKTPRSVYLGQWFNETASHCSWHLPQAHWLESWDILLTGDNTLSAVQPLIAPLYEGKTKAELLSIMLDDTPRSAYDLARSGYHFWRTGRKSLADGDSEFEKEWRTYLHRGFVISESPVEATNATDMTYALPATNTPPQLSATNLELVITADSKLLDGRYANNAWLQELPDFMTKLTWDNAALISPALSEELNLVHGDVVTLEFNERHIDMPIYVQPGQAHYSVSVAVGYGRTHAGRVGNGVGANVYRLRTVDHLWGGPGLKLSPTGKKHALACTQDHHAIDATGMAERERRAVQLVREGTLAEYKEHPDFADHLGVHHPPLVSMWKEHQTDGHRWAMAIDLNRCVGCNACVVACQAENNIPVVGKEQVAKGREMHWLRMDRYFLGDADDPTVVHQPVGCVHCELAPCEQVCPVAATIHSEEGLNVMVYNRCVGTRYCSNNCPYKVRRFNFFNYRKDLTEVEKLAFNPDVSVRARGVMEKCTYCVQRIETARINARNTGKPIQDGDITPACAQTCPSDAIVFGDLSDPDSRVAKLTADPRSYALLEELNIKPRTNYLARIRNPHPDLITHTPKADHS
jgi:MoCo/4Fe-4S cofactor protein with predicted Tat translocation signal